MANAQGQYGLDRNGELITLSDEMLKFPKLMERIGARKISHEQAQRIINRNSGGKAPVAPVKPVTPVEVEPVLDIGADDDEPSTDGEGAGVSDYIAEQLAAIDAEKDKDRLEAIGRTYGIEVDKRKGLAKIQEQVKAAFLAEANGENAASDLGEGE